MEYETKQKSYQRAVRIDNRPQTTKTAPLHARTHTHTLSTYEEQKEHTNLQKKYFKTRIVPPTETNVVLRFVS
jgi:hypothetical protein